MINPRKLGIIALGSTAAVLCLGSIVYARTGSVLPTSHHSRSATVVKVGDDGSSTTLAAGDDSSSSSSASGGTAASTASTEAGTASAVEGSSSSSNGTGATAGSTATTHAAGDDGAKASTSSSEVERKGDDATTAAPGTAGATAATTEDAPHGSTATTATPETTATTAASTVETPAPTDPPATPAPAHGAEVVTIGKCVTNASATTGGELIIQAKSSNPDAILTAYRSDGTVIGVVVNGGTGKYGGTVMPHQTRSPGSCTVRSSTGASATAPTGPMEGHGG